MTPWRPHSALWRTHSCVQRSHSLENSAQVVDFVDARCRAGLHPAADLQSALAVAWFLPLETARRADCRSCERVFELGHTCSQECEHTYPDISLWCAASAGFWTTGMTIC